MQVINPSLICATEATNRIKRASFLLRMKEGRRGTEMLKVA